MDQYYDDLKLLFSYADVHYALSLKIVFAF